MSKSEMFHRSFMFVGGALAGSAIGYLVGAFASTAVVIISIVIAVIMRLGDAYEPRDYVTSAQNLMIISFIVSVVYFHFLANYINSLFS